MNVGFVCAAVATLLTACLCAGCASQPPPTPAAARELAPGGACDLCLSRELKQARIVHAPTSPQVTELFLRDNLEAAAGSVEDMKASGFIAAALQWHGVDGAAVAPPE